MSNGGFPYIPLVQNLFHTIGFYFPRLVSIVSLGVVYALPVPCSMLILKNALNMLIQVPEFMQKRFGVMFWIHTIMQLDLKVTRSVIAISSPHPTKDTFTKKSFVIHINNQLIVRKMFIHEPIHDSFTPSLTIIIPRKSKIKHN